MQCSIFNFKFQILFSFLLVLGLACFLPSQTFAIDTHGYGQSTCGSNSICYTGSQGTLTPGSQCGNLPDWQYGFDVNKPSEVASCFFGKCCDPKGSAVATSPISPTATPVVSPPGCNKSTENGPCTIVDTALGPIPTNPTGLVKAIFSILLSVSGGVALLLIIAAGYQMMTSQGNPEKVKEARERLTSAIVGLLFIIFSVAILQIIGVDILQIPGFSR